MALQNPQINFIDAGAVHSDAASMFLASAKAAQAMRLARQKQQLDERTQMEHERRARALEAADEQRIGLEGRRVGQEDRRQTEDERRTQRTEKYEDIDRQVKTVDIAAEKLDADSPHYNPASGQNLITAHGGQLNQSGAPSAALPEADAPLPPAFMMVQSPPAKATAKVGEGAPAADRRQAELVDAGLAPPPIDGEASTAAPAAPPETPRGPSISLGGKDFRLDPGARHAGLDAQREKAAIAIEGMKVFKPFLADDFNAIAQMVRGKILKPEEGDEMAKFLVSQRGLDARAEVVAAMRAKEAASREATARAGLGIRTEGATSQNLRDYQNEKKRYFQRTDVPANTNSFMGIKREYEVLVDGMKKNKINPMQAQTAIYSIVRSMQPGDPRISNADYDAINRAGQSLYGRGENWVEGIMTGAPGDEKMHNMINLLGEGINRSAANLSRARTSFASEFGPGSAYYQSDPSVAAQIERDYQSLFGDSLGAGRQQLPQNKNLPVAPRKKSGGKTTIRVNVSAPVNRGRSGFVDGKPAIIYPDGTYEER